MVAPHTIFCSNAGCKFVRPASQQPRPTAHSNAHFCSPPSTSASDSMGRRPSSTSALDSMGRDLCELRVGPVTAEIDHANGEVENAPASGSFSPVQPADHTMSRSGGLRRTISGWRAGKRALGGGRLVWRLGLALG
jgi:hypothetical protein